MLAWYQRTCVCAIVIKCVRVYERSHGSMFIRIYYLILAWLLRCVTHFQISALACFLFARNYVSSAILGHIGAYASLCSSVFVLYDLKYSLDIFYLYLVHFSHIYCSLSFEIVSIFWYIFGFIIARCVITRHKVQQYAWVNLDDAGYPNRYKIILNS